VLHSEPKCILNLAIKINDENKTMHGDVIT